MRRLLAFAMLLCLAIPAQAGTLPGIGTAVRHAVPVDKALWLELGRVQTELGGRCTGFLVAPSVIMTAAHCLYLPRTGHYLQPSSVHFLLGYAFGSWRDEAHATGFVIAPGYDPEHPLRTSQSDRATVILDRPVGRAQDILPVVEARAGEDAMLAGYEQDSAEHAVGDVACHVLRRRGSLIDHDCGATHGASGAPLLVRSGGVWGVAGIAVTAQPDRGGTALSIGLPANKGTLRN